MPKKDDKLSKPEPKEKEKPTNYLFWEGEECETDEIFCKKLNDFVDGHPVISKYHGVWKQIIEWVEGNQFTWLDGSKLKPVNFNIRKKQVVINIMKPLNEAIEGKLNINTSVVGVPNSGEQQDIKGAEVASRLIAHNDYINDIESAMDDIVYDLLHPGTSCIFWYFDKNHPGGFINGEKKGSGKIKKVKEKGEVVCRPVPIFNVRPDPLAKTPKDLRYVAEVLEMGEEELLQAFPKVTRADLEELAQEEKSEKYKGMNVPQDERGDAKSHRVIYFFERGSNRYPEGRYMVTLGNKIVQSGSNPTPDGDLPYVFWYYKKTPYSFWGRSPAYYILGIQRELNRTVSMISEHIEAWRPKMVVPRGSLTNAEAFTIDSFELLEIDQGRGTPTPLSMPQLSTQVLEYRDFLISSMDKVSNVHEVSYSRLPQYASRAPASLYSMMLEQENIKLSSMVKRMNSSLVEQAKLRLKLMGKHYKMPRMTRIMGKQRSAAVDYFDAGDLNGNYDVKLEVGVTMVQSTATQVRMLMELWDKGFFKDNDRNKIIQVLNLGTAEREIRSDTADMEKAIRENQAFLDGKSSELQTYPNFLNPGANMAPSPVYIHDDHELHLEYHTDLAKSEEYGDMEESEQNALQVHIAEHFIYFQAATMRGQGMPAGGGQAAVGPSPQSASPAPQNIPGRSGVPGPTPESTAQVRM